MTVARGPARSNLLVLAALLAALAAGLVFVWTQWLAVEDQRLVVDRARDGAARLDARFTALQGRVPGAADETAPDPFLAGASATIAGANLQTQVVSAIRGAGGTVTSSTVTTPATTPQSGAGNDAMPAAIQLTVSCQIAQGALQALLYGLENGTPALFLDQLSIDAGVPDNRDPSQGSTAGLKIAMTVTAYWNGDKRS